MRIPRGGAGGRGKVRDSDSASPRAFAGRTPRKPAARGAGGDAPRGGGVFYEAAQGHAGGQGSARLFGRSGARRGSNRSVRTGLCAFGRRSPLPPSKPEIS